MQIKNDFFERGLALKKSGYEFNSWHEQEYTRNI